MAQINVSNLTFGYEGSYDTIFENVSFSIDTSWKLGFVGRRFFSYSWENTNTRERSPARLSSIIFRIR